MPMRRCTAPRRWVEIACKSGPAESATPVPLCRRAAKTSLNFYLDAYTVMSLYATFLYRLFKLMRRMAMASRQPPSKARHVQNRPLKASADRQDSLGQKPPKHPYGAPVPEPLHEAIAAER